MKKNNRTIHIVGINSYKFKDLKYNIRDLLIKTKNIAVPSSFIKEIKSWETKGLIKDKNFFISNSNSNLIKWLKSLDNDAVLISRGDPLWFGIGRILIKNFSQNELSFYPANTCIQLACSKLKKSWQDIKTISIHGRDSKELVKSLKSKEKNIAILTDPKIKSLDLIRKNLEELNLNKSYEFWLFEDIGYDNEKISLIKSEENLPENISKLNIVILFKKERSLVRTSLPLFGINDNYFETFDDRPNLITKREIRIQILADLELPEFGTLLDIGSGSGSIGLEAIRLRPKIELICIDKRLGSSGLITENAKNLGVKPLKIIEGDINQNLNKGLTKLLLHSKRVIIGGCDLDTKILVIKFLSTILKTGDIFVLPLITYETIEKIDLTFKKLNYETNISLIQTYKGLSIAEGTRFEPNNPIFIFKAKKIYD
tara:strand:- start:358 stop:1641 length:1284 start_codon:yes stop_codon:yes gene_type:complete